MSREDNKPVYAIGAFRTVGGLSPWLAPNLLARTYGADRLQADTLHTVSALLTASALKAVGLRE